MNICGQGLSLTLKDSKVIVLQTAFMIAWILVEVHEHCTEKLNHSTEQGGIASRACLPAFGQRPTLSVHSLPLAASPNLGSFACTSVARQSLV